MISTWKGVVRKHSGWSGRVLTFSWCEESSRFLSCLIGVAKEKGQDRNSGNPRVFSQPPLYFSFSLTLSSPPTAWLCSRGQRTPAKGASSTVPQDKTQQQAGLPCPQVFRQAPGQATLGFASPSCQKRYSKKNLERS